MESKLGSLTDLFLLGVASGTVALTLTRSHITAPIRDRLLGVPLLGELTSCPFCVAHWCGLAAALTLPATPLAYLFNAFIIIGMATLFQGAVMRLWLMQESEVDRLKDLLKEARKHVRKTEPDW